MIIKMINDNIVLVLAAIAGVIVLTLICLLIALAVIKFKEKRSKKLKEIKEKSKYQIKKSNIVYTPESIFDFMEFERIQDNMIIQRNGKYLMIVECQGINYD